LQKIKINEKTQSSIFRKIFKVVTHISVTTVVKTGKLYKRIPAEQNREENVTESWHRCSCWDEFWPVEVSGVELEGHIS
jgi:hypothetical protein